MVTGDTNHWCRELYAARAARLILYGRALGLSHGEAEDVLQEVFLALLRLETAPRDLEHYVVRAYRNRAFSYRRGWLRRLARELESRAWFERTEREDPQEERALRRLEDLPVEQREVIVLKIWQGWTFEAIGETTGVSPNTAAGRYRYGMARLRRALEGETDERDYPRRAVGWVDTAPPLGPA